MKAKRADSEHPGSKKAVTIRLLPRDLQVLQQACRPFGGIGPFLAELAAAVRESAAQKAPAPADSQAPSRPALQPRRPSPKLAAALAELESRYPRRAPAARPAAANAGFEEESHDSG